MSAAIDERECAACEGLFPPTEMHAIVTDAAAWDSPADGVDLCDACWDERWDERIEAEEIRAEAKAEDRRTW